MDAATTFPLRARASRRWRMRAAVVAGVLAIGVDPAAAYPTLEVACGDVAGLRAAIEIANGRAGDDTISLAPSCTYTIADEYVKHEALPAFTKKSIILEGNGATIRRADGDIY